MTRSASRGTSGRILHHHRLAAPRGSIGDRHRRPHPDLELTAKLFNQALFVRRELWVTLGFYDLAERRATTKRKNLIGQDYMPSMFHRPGARSDAAQPVAHRLRRHPLRHARGFERILAERELCGKRRGMRAAGAV